MKRKEIIRIILGILAIFIGGFLGGYAPVPLKHVIGFVTGMTVGCLVTERGSKDNEQG